jgi:hypothetical protein
VVDADLGDEERFVLGPGLVEWGGPARCTDTMAIAMGFADVHDLFREPPGSCPGSVPEKDC